jgi:hypothetical protein
MSSYSFGQNKDGGIAISNSIVEHAALAQVLDLLRDVLPIDMLDTMLSQDIYLILHPCIVIAFVEIRRGIANRSHQLSVY